LTFVFLQPCKTMCKHIMQSFKSEVILLRTRVVGAIVALVCSLATISAVFMVFASVSGELDPLLAKAKVAPAASAVASKTPAKRVRS
jgi:hypothetical protein